MRWPVCLRFRAKKFRYAVPELVRPCLTFRDNFPKDIHGVPVPAALVPALKKRPWPPPNPNDLTLFSTHVPVMLTLMKYVSAQASPISWASASTTRSASDRFALKGTRRRTWAPGFITSKCSPCTFTKCGSPVAETPPAGAEAAAGMPPGGMAAPAGAEAAAGMPPGGMAAPAGAEAAAGMPPGGMAAPGMAAPGMAAPGMAPGAAAGMPAGGMAAPAGMPGGSMAPAAAAGMPSGGMAMPAGGVSWPERLGRCPPPVRFCVSFDISIEACVIVAYTESTKTCTAACLARHGAARVAKGQVLILPEVGLIANVSGCVWDEWSQEPK